MPLAHVGVWGGEGGAICEGCISDGGRMADDELSEGAFGGAGGDKGGGAGGGGGGKSHAGSSGQTKLVPAPQGVVLGLHCA